MRGIMPSDNHRILRSEANISDILIANRY